MTRTTWDMEPMGQEQSERLKGGPTDSSQPMLAQALSKAKYPNSDSQNSHRERAVKEELITENLQAQEVTTHCEGDNRKNKQ